MQHQVPAVVPTQVVRRSASGNLTKVDAPPASSSESMPTPGSRPLPRNSYSEKAISDQANFMFNEVYTQLDQPEAPCPPLLLKSKSGERAVEFDQMPQMPTHGDLHGQFPSLMNSTQGFDMQQQRRESVIGWERKE